MSERLVSIAVAQVLQTDNPQINLEKMIWAMDQVRTDVIVFPETQLSGVDKESDRTPLHRALSNKARSHRQWLVYGSYERRGNEVFNNALIRDHRGNLRLDYQKQHLWNEPGVTPGSKNMVVNTEIGNLGLVICWDLAHSGSVRKLTQRGAELVFCPSYWFGKTYHTTEVIERLPLVRAFENQVYLAYYDAYTENGETAARSKICSPLKNLASARPQREEIITAIVNLSELQGLRQTFDCWNSP